MKTNKLIFTFLIFIFAFGTASAQYEDFENSRSQNSTADRREWFLDHFTFGGNFGLCFGDYTSVVLNPCFGYRINSHFNAGVTATYDYTSYADNFKQSIYGGGIYLEAYPIQCLVIHGEAQYLSYKKFYDGYYFYPEPDRAGAMPILVGGGYRKMLTDRASINLMLLWNVNATRDINDNIYTNPILRVSLIF